MLTDIILKFKMSYSSKSRKYQGVFMVKCRVKTWQVSGIWSRQLEHKPVPNWGTVPVVRKNMFSLMACHNRYKCSMETTHNSVKVKLGIKVMKLVESLIGHCWSRVRATLLLPTWICSCQLVETVNFILPFTTNVTISISILQTFRSWVATSHLRQSMAFLYHNLSDTPGLAPLMNVLFWGRCDFPISFSGRVMSRNVWNRL